MTADRLAGEVAFSESVVASVRHEFLPIDRGLLWEEGGRY